MSSPHVAGAAAVLKQANPKLTVTQLQQALTATATPLAKTPHTQIGFGHVNLDKAVALVKRKDYAKAIKKLQAKAERRLLAEDEWKVTRADVWQAAAPPVAIGGSYSSSHEVKVARGTDALKVVLIYPTPGTAANLASFYATVTDAKGNEVAVTETDIFYGIGLANVLVKGVKPGKHTIEVVGEYAVSDPDTIDSDSVNGRVVYLNAAQLQKR